MTSSVCSAAVSFCRSRSTCACSSFVQAKTYSFTKHWRASAQWNARRFVSGDGSAQAFAAATSIVALTIVRNLSSAISQTCAFSSKARSSTSLETAVSPAGPRRSFPVNRVGHERDARAIASSIAGSARISFMQARARSLGRVHCSSMARVNRWRRRWSLGADSIFRTQRAKLDLYSCVSSSSSAHR